VLYTRADTPPRTFGPLLQLLPSLQDNLPPGFQERLESLIRAEEVSDAPQVGSIGSWRAIGCNQALAADGAVAFVLDDVQ
jgi:hypothetical protein